jgi:hypothetical protein
MLFSCFLLIVVSSSCPMVIFSLGHVPIVAFSSVPIMATHDISSNVGVSRPYAGYGNNYNLNNVQACAHEGKELETKLAINVDGVDDAYLLEVHLEI